MTLTADMQLPRFEGERVWWTYDMVRDALAEAAALWRRSPGGGTSPFATDGPWELMQREERKGDYDARGGDGVSSDVALRPLPLSRDEVRRRDMASEWLALVVQVEDRHIVIMASVYLSTGRATVPWRRIKHRLGIRFGEDGLRKRYDRAISDMAKSLNTAEMRR